LFNADKADLADLRRNDLAWKQQGSARRYRLDRHYRRRLRT